MFLSIGLMGLVGSGKDTFGDMLMKELTSINPRFRTDSYANPLKELGAKILGIDKKNIDKRDVKETEVKLYYTKDLEDTLYKFMEYDLGFCGVELSEGLRRLREVFGGVTEISPRSFYQGFGTDVVRSVRDDAWITKLHRSHKYHPVLVTDVRFLNEICDINILVIRHEGIKRPVHTSEHLAWDLQFSSVDLPKELLTVDNREDLESLKNKVGDIIEYLKAKKYL